LPPAPSRVEPIVESSKDKDVDVHEDEITAKDIKEDPSISSSLIAIPTTVLPSKKDANGVGRSDTNEGQMLEESQKYKKCLT
jgi:hypothetical protein